MTGPFFPTGSQVQIFLVSKAKLLVEKAIASAATSNFVGVIMTTPHLLVLMKQCVLVVARILQENAAKIKRKL